MNVGLGPLMLMLGIGALPYVLIAKRYRSKKDKRAWNAYALDHNLRCGPGAYETARDAWDSALQHVRRDDRDTLERKIELENILVHASEIVRVSVGLRKAQDLLLDDSVPGLVRASILTHWFGQWNTHFGIWPQGEFDEREIYLKIRSELDRLRSEHGRSGGTAGLAGPRRENRSVDLETFGKDLAEP